MRRQLQGSRWRLPRRSECRGGIEAAPWKMSGCGQRSWRPPVVRGKREPPALLRCVQRLRMLPVATAWGVWGMGVVIWGVERDVQVGDGVWGLVQGGGM